MLKYLLTILYSHQREQRRQAAWDKYWENHGELL